MLCRIKHVLWCTGCLCGSFRTCCVDTHVCLPESTSAGWIHCTHLGLRLLIRPYPPFKLSICPSIDPSIEIHTYIPYHTIPYHTIPYHTIPYHTITLHYITLHYITLHYITLQYSTVQYITLHYITHTHADIQTYRHTDIQTYRQTYIHTYINSIYIYHVKWSHKMFQKQLVETNNPWCLGNSSHLLKKVSCRCLMPDMPPKSVHSEWADYIYHQVYLSIGIYVYIYRLYI